MCEEAGSNAGDGCRCRARTAAIASGKSVGRGKEGWSVGRGIGRDGARGGERKEELSATRKLLHSNEGCFCFSGRAVSPAETQSSPKGEE